MGFCLQLRAGLGLEEQVLDAEVAARVQGLGRRIQEEPSMAALILLETVIEYLFSISKLKAACLYTFL